MKDEQLQIFILEKQILHSIIDDSSLFIEDDIFISEQAIELQYILSILKEKGLDFSVEHILSNAQEYINKEVLDTVLHTSYQKDKFWYYVDILRQKSILNNLKVDLLYELSKDDTDFEKILYIKKSLDNSLFHIQNPNIQGKSFSELVKNHIEVIKKRATGIQLTTGCYLFDKILSNPVAGIAILAGFSGSCKSTLIQYLMNQRLVKRLPTTYFNTELSMNGVMDGMLSSLSGIPYKDILGLNNDDNHIDFDKIIGSFGKIEKNYKKNHSFLMFPESSVSLKDIRDFNIYARKQFNLKDEDLLVCGIDLLSMVKEFSQESKTSRADSITMAINELNNIALENNILIIGTVQLRRMPSHKIEKEEDIEKYRPTLDMIKDSGSYEERARWIFSIHNPYHIVRKSNCSSLIRDLTNPIVYIKVLKDTYTGKTGNEIGYYFNSLFKDFSPFNDDLTNNIDISSEQKIEEVQNG